MRTRRFFDGAAVEIGSLPIESVSADQGVTLGAISSGVVFYSPTVTSVRNITTGKPFVSTFLFGPSVTYPFGQIVDLSYLTITPEVYAPTVIENPIHLNVIGPTASVFNPSVTAQSSVDLSLISSSTQFFGCSVGRGAVAVDLLSVGPTAQFAAPSVVPGAVGVTLSLLNPSGVVRQPGMTSEAFVAPQVLGSASTVAQPALSSVATMIAPFIGSATQVYGLSITSAFVDLTVLSSSSTVRQPSISSVAYVAPELLTSGTSYGPMVIPGPVNVSLNVLASASVVRSVLVEPGPVYISPALIGPLSLVYASLVSGEQRPTPHTPYLMVRWRDDNKEWSREVRIDLGDVGETEVVRRLNFTGMFTTRQYEFSCTENIALTFGSAEEDIEFML